MATMIAVWLMRSPSPPALENQHSHSPGTSRRRAAAHPRQAKPCSPVRVLLLPMMQTFSCGPSLPASMVARGSLPRIIPVKSWSNTANPMATACGTFIVGAGNPVRADSLSRICFNVRFSPPRMYRCPGRRFFHGQHVSTGNLLHVGQIQSRIDIAGNFRFRKSTTILPVGVGLMSYSPIGVVGFTNTTFAPLLPASSAICSAMNL